MLEYLPHALALTAWTGFSWWWACQAVPTPPPD